MSFYSGFIYKASFSRFRTSQASVWVCEPVCSVARISDELDQPDEDADQDSGHDMRRQQIDSWVPLPPEAKFFRTSPLVSNA